MLSGGSGEIEAAKLRLAAAKSKKESALEMVKSAKDLNKTAEVMTSSARDMTDKAKTMMDAATAMTNTARTNTESAKAMAKMASSHMVAAQSQLDTAETEVTEADAMLTRAEEKWQVIDVDDSPKKAEKSSNSATHNSDNQAKAGEVIDLDAEIAAGLDSGNHLSDIVEIAAAVFTHNLSAAVAARNTQQITVKGCGIPNANGIYKRDNEFIGSTHHNSFTKKGWSNQITYVIYRKDSYWYLSTWTGHSVSKTLYRTMNKSKTGLPPESGWITIDGEIPSPRLSM